MSEIPPTTLTLVRNRARKWAWRARNARFLELDDFVQETLLHLWVSYYRWGRTPSAGEIAVVVRRAAIGLIPTKRISRAGRRIREFYWPEVILQEEEFLQLPQPPDPFTDPVQAVERRERLGCIAVWYDTLFSREKLIVDASLAGRSAREIASDLGVVESRISQLKSHLFRDIAAL